MKLPKIIGLMGAFSSLALASGLNTNTNQSAAYLRNVARYATTEADAPYYNPAGTAFMTDGFHISLNSQAFWQSRNTYTESPLFGGEKKFLNRLDELFSMDLDKKYYEDNEDIEEECLLGGYVHGNEPSHHVPYLYAWTSQPWKAQYWLREIMNRMYVNNIDGLHGNDDCGQMSAWYIFTAMGFYPVCPGTDQYVLGAPYVPYVRLTLDNGKTLEIKADGVDDLKRYVKNVLLNGKTLTRRYIIHQEILDGGVLEFQMSDKPNKRSAQKELPYSLTD